MDRRQTWMVKELSALEEFAQNNDWDEVVSLLRIARRTTAGDLREVSGRLSMFHQKYDDDWFETAIDQLTRHAHDNNLSEVEMHLTDARMAWDLSISSNTNDLGGATGKRSH
ncbi:MAG: hypothetical protein ACR2O1_11560 [Boseongicola sp.]